MKKIAVAIIHGIGRQDKDFASGMIGMLKKNFAKKIGNLVTDPSSQLIFQPIQWSEVLENREEELYEKIVLNHKLDYQKLRHFLIHYMGDVIAYQPVESAKHNYERVHEKIAENLRELANNAGGNAPLCVISHSLGSVITSNYFYDLQYKENDGTVDGSQFSPLENGDTITLFYTLGTTLPLWSLRYFNFDQPIKIPSPKLKEFYPGLNGEWINFYDKDDILGYPLRPINDIYKNAVTEDRQVNVGNILTSWNPLCHMSYFRDKDVIEGIADGLVRTWRHINKPN
ncbi:chemotaxis protein [Neobacillus citreus]|uniref:Chemotaxis protein n=1 Tax=Neobacillus citreus TaxID=2833578 RepID=A0A942Y7W9_9BACI|nr:chemotaxis protein [Neobacillus citreus]